MMSDEKAGKVALVPASAGRSSGSGRYRGDRDDGLSELVSDQRHSPRALLRELDSRSARDRRIGRKMDQAGRRQAVLVLLSCARYGFALLALIIVVLTVASLWTL